MTHGDSHSKNAVRARKARRITRLSENLYHWSAPARPHDRKSPKTR